MDGLRQGVISCQGFGYTTGNTMTFQYERELERLKEIARKAIIKTTFRPADKDSLEYLVSEEYPPEIINFHQFAEPDISLDHGNATLLPVRSLKEENQQAVPSCIVYPFGYRAIAATYYGNVFCVDINRSTGHHYGSIYYVNHDEAYEDMGKETVDSILVKTADNFRGFLKLFCEGKLGKR